MSRRVAADQRQLSRRGLEFIASWEGFRGYAYNDAAGHATVGFGHLLHLGSVTPRDRVTYGTASNSRLSRESALLLLRADAARAEHSVRDTVRVPVNQAEYDALVSLAYNIGVYAFEASTVLKQLNRNHRRLAGAAFLLFCKAGGRVLDGLLRRRKAERSMFRTGVYRGA